MKAWDFYAVTVREITPDRKPVFSIYPIVLRGHVQCISLIFRINFNAEGGIHEEVTLKDWQNGSGDITLTPSLAKGIGTG